jgi:thiamine-phosphate pyrophosphorylase
LRNNFKKILITDSFYSQNPTKFAFLLYKILRKKRADFVILRDKKNKNLFPIGKYALKITRLFNTKLLINQNISLYHKLKPFGIQLTSNQFNKLKKIKGYKIISTHNEKEIKKAKRLGANAVLYSPIFTTPGKGKPKGIKNLKNITKNNQIDIYALGGIISLAQIEQIKKTKAKGFASIRYWYAKEKST